MRNSVMVIGVLLLLTAAAALAYYGLVHGPDAALGVHGWTAMVLGVVFIIAVGTGLMTLMFYSSRHGYDDAAHIDPSRRKQQR